MSRGSRPSVLLAGLVLAAGCAAPVAGVSTGSPAQAPAPPSLPGPAVPGGAAGPCPPGPAVQVADGAALAAALAAAGPGTTIRLLDGTYPGHFAITRSGSADAPVTLCGGRGAVLDGGPTATGYTLHLDAVEHWRLLGFTVRGGQKGLMLDGSRRVLVDGLLVHDVGDEAVHLRAGSSDNVVRRNTVRGTGLRRAEFGEGIYVGSARSNWCRHSGCAPDRSDRNLIEDNDISATTAESVDIKEGTTGGVLRGNRFAGAGMHAADSWVDVKGSGWTITGNAGVDAPQDGFQVHAVAPASGEDNTFADNVATVNGPGYGFAVTGPDRGNRVACSNRVTAAGSGLSNLDCR